MADILEGGAFGTNTKDLADLVELPGTLEYRGRTADASRAFVLPPFLGSRYVAEVDISLTGNAAFRWWIRSDLTTKRPSHYQLDLTSQFGSADILYFSDVTTRESVIAPVRISRPEPSVVLAIVAEGSRYSLFVDQHQVFEFHGHTRPAIFQRAGLLLCRCRHRNGSLRPLL